ncbi:MAG: transporter related protein [Xanthobacteraceae bacterium]|nr:transporter related protein [Xanthobacteraceae bacterium]
MTVPFKPTLPSTAPLLEIDALDAWYGAAQVLFGLSLSIGQGEAVALLGRNGAGKSTALKAIMGLVARRARRLNFAGASIARAPTYAIARRGLGYVPEDRRIFTDLTVAENLDIGRQRSRVLPDGLPAPAWTREGLLELFPNLAGMLDRRGDHMSGGEQQMLTVARTLMGNPLLILLDEPSEGVAPVLIEQLALAIAALKKKGLSILLCEQNFQFCEMICERAFVIEHGEMRWSGAMSALRNSPDAMRDYLSV